MKSVKKLMLAIVFAMIISLGLFSSTLSAKAESANAIEQMTPWILTFDNGQIVHIKKENQQYIEVASNSISVTYMDTTGETSGGYFEIWVPDIGVVPERPISDTMYLENGQTQTFDLGGTVTFRYKTGDDTSYSGGFTSVSMYISRSIITSDRISTNYVEGQYVYERVDFCEWDTFRYGDQYLYSILRNLRTGEIKTQSDFCFWYVEEPGEYELEIQNKFRNESRTWYFIIEKNSSFITLENWNNQVITPLNNCDYTWAGVKVSYPTNLGISNISYEYQAFDSAYVEKGTVDNEFIFWRKGQYKVTVTTSDGKVCSKFFTITNFGILCDPQGASTYGTEVLQNGGEYGGTTLSVGYTRCLFLDGNAPSQSRLKYNFTSSNNDIATVSEYGTVTAKQAGVVIITCTLKSNPTIVSKIVLIVRP